MPGLLFYIYFQAFLLHNRASLTEMAGLLCNQPGGFSNPAELIFEVCSIFMHFRISIYLGSLLLTVPIIGACALT